MCVCVYKVLSVAKMEMKRMSAVKNIVSFDLLAVFPRSSAAPVPNCGLRPSRPAAATQCIPFVNPVFGTSLNTFSSSHFDFYIITFLWSKGSGEEGIKFFGFHQMKAWRPPI